MHRSSRLAMPLVGLFLATGTASAQDVKQSAHQADVTHRSAVASPAFGVAPANAAGMAAAAGPAQARAAAGVRAPRAEVPRAPVPAPRVESRQNKAMMVVGFAGLITGAIIGGDAGTIIMVGGAGLGLFGLYKYLE
jgi:hypothetical protein